jgi:hypothetical protein
MIRRWLWLGLLVLCAHAALAAKPISIDEFEGQLNRLHGKSDDFVVDHISSFELTQRATFTRLTHWLADFHGRKSQMTLIAIADNSAFLDLPPSDSPSIDPPSDQERGVIISRAIASLETTTHRLPDLSATRNTLEFDDSEEDEGQLIFNLTAPPIKRSEPERRTHLIGKNSVRVSYVHGAEIFNNRDAAKIKRAGTGLTTWGEFGLMLSGVLGDIGSEGLSWKGWERSGIGTLAVFHYAVPRGRGHYLVSVRPRVPPQYPAYHGEIAIDLETYNVTRVTMQANPTVGPSTASANIAVEYGRVSIGDQMYNCPVHAVASSQGIDLDSAGKALAQLNDIQFTDYHLYRGEVRIVPDTPAQAK